MPASLTIAIPTYNRAPKLARLLGLLCAELRDPVLASRVQVLVSDNASADDTADVVEQARSAGVTIRYHRQAENLRFDGNVRALYLLADTDYVWYFGDDDLPLPGACAAVLEALDTARPDVLLSSFIQPLGSMVRQFRFPEPVHLVSDPAQMPRLVAQYPKLTIYVLRRVQFAGDEWARIDRSLESGWYFLALAYAVLDAAATPRLAVRSAPLASCDDEVEQIDWAPTPMLRITVPLSNDFVRRHDPALLTEQDALGYAAAIQFCIAVKFGTLVPSDAGAYDDFIRRLPIRPALLLRRPRSLVQLLLLKLGLAHLWPSRGARAMQVERAA